MVGTSNQVDTMLGADSLHYVTNCCYTVKTWGIVRRNVRVVLNDSYIASHRTPKGAFMKTYLLIITFAASAITAVSYPSMAAAAGDIRSGVTIAPKHGFQKIDTDGDGKISRAEAAARPRLAERFDVIDANKDGFITRDEMRAAHQKLAAAKFNSVDTNGDGRISRAEAVANAPRLAKRFSVIDTNKDGFVSREELTAAKRKVADRRKD